MMRSRGVLPCPRNIVFRAIDHSPREEQDRAEITDSDTRTTLYPRCGKGTTVETYDVVVRNELTGEVTTVGIRSWDAQEAQSEALIYLFRSRGWRKALALWPEVVQLARSA